MTDRRFLDPIARVALCVALLFAQPTSGMAAQAGALEMNTKGDCSPAVANTTGNVTIICGGVPAAALAALNDELKRREVERSKLVAEANDWAARFHALEAKVASVDNGSAVAVAARQKLERGDLTAAAGEIQRLQDQLTLDQAEVREKQKVSRQQTKVMLDLVMQEGLKPGGVFRTDTRWTKPVISICFLDGSRPLRAYVASVGSEWTLYGNIEFDFGLLTNPRTCDPKAPSDVRISLVGDGFWSYVGAELAKYGTTGPTSNIGLGRLPFEEAASGKYRGSILHEFGHILGFTHETQRPQSACLDDIDFNKAYALFGGAPNNWTKAQVDANLRPQPGQALQSGVFDNKSVMHYTLPVQIFKGGRNSPCFHPDLQELSLGDRLAVAQIYP